MAELTGNDDKVACFELYRRNTRSPEIITFDELYQRARCIVENISAEIEAETQAEPEERAAGDDYGVAAFDSGEDIPF